MRANAGDYMAGATERTGLLLENANLTIEAAREIRRSFATSQDQSVQPRYAATWRGVMQVGLLRSHGRLLRPISACDRMKLQTFFDAAHLLICCEPRWAGRDMPVGLLIVERNR